ncbi:hypothetical protein JJV70_03525 [Streptomyces sp. JJ66]|nr:hypothetical protein [Streptomyces sp. JJ66]
MLEQTRKDIKNISDQMKKPCREMEKVDGAAMGVTELEARMDQFGDEWSHGIKQLAKFSDVASEALAEIKKGFEEIDTKYADALRNPQKGGGK